MHLGERVGRTLKLHDLNVLMAVVQAGSMSKAAAMLNTTQSAVSRSIAELEQTIGARLLDRNARGVEPTQCGEALLKRSMAAFDELKQGVRDIEYLTDPAGGELHIGSTPAMAEAVVLAVIERLSSRYPRVVFQIGSSGLLALYDDLRARRIEIGFSQLFGAPDADDMCHEVLFEQPLVVVAGLENPWSRRRKIELGELLEEPWTWPRAGTAFDIQVVEAFRSKGLTPPRATVYADAINMRTKLAANGRFLAIVPAYIMQFAGKHSPVKVLPVELTATHREIGIITLKDRTLSPLAQRFIECAREVAKQLAKKRA